MKFDDLLAAVDFLYHGEANVFQEHLDSFLTIAEELQLKGLMGRPDERVKDFEEDDKLLLHSFNDNVNISKESFKKPILEKTEN